MGKARRRAVVISAGAIWTTVRPQLRALTSLRGANESLAKFWLAPHCVFDRNDLVGEEPPPRQHHIHEGQRRPLPRKDFSHRVIRSILVGCSRNGLPTTYTGGQHQSGLRSSRM